jgi:ActR/RegA family two-component response regulator
MQNDFSTIRKTRVLFVDDEPTIRLTLPAILEQEGFAVSVAASVPEALEIIHRETFEVLLTDLNIGGPADGFILVTAMRRIQPHSATFILTGYPDFQTALEAIRQQVDDYFTKPADIATLVATLKDKSAKPRPSRQGATKRVSDVICENSGKIVQRWLKDVRADSRLASIPITDSERIDRLPLLLKDLANALKASPAQLPSESFTTAAIHGADRARQGYTIPMLVAETRILNRTIASLLHESLLSIDLSTLISDALRVGEYLQALLEESIRVFQSVELAPARKFKVRVGKR